MASTIATKEIPDSRPMNGGDGDNSYFQNSTYQRGAVEGSKGVIFETIPDKLDINNLPKTFRIADFGCSTGPNTFFAMKNIMEAVMLKYQSTQEANLRKTTPEFHVSFNDHVDNDFNTLFKTLPPNRPYFAVGVPGSFHCQLLPEASLNIAHSSYALHWLSKVPPQVMDKGSPAWNRGKIYCAGNEKEVTKAYFAQFKADTDAFLKARAQELVEGGLVVVQISGVPNSKVLPSQIGGGLNCELLGDSLADMVKMGVITEEKLDSFNLPLYLPSNEEVKMVVEMNKCFTIEKICSLSHPSNYDPRPLDIERTCADVRAIKENLMQDHFGSENMDQLFHLFGQNLQKNRLLYDKVVRQDVYHFALLKRKGNI
ncbi:loganic acid O-methyltransferase-like isoform X2 [Rhododendron vialii]|uniref:loganic acid O-methyltransferase-like isoform X2 n=1 Tax=Rhododendron vialii TaxID=182163 RepID=UPI00265ED14F|nr:loganic acid O-methyltransferase-like isoform X2 [Rhododendron vialii]